MRKRFGNLDSVGAGKASKDQFDRWREDRLRKFNKEYGETVPNVTPDLPFLQNNRSEPSLTWIGHSTFLIQMGGLNIVTDPVWARRMAFRSRMAPPGIELSDMPPVDLVLISHSHYDHMHISSLRRLCGPKKMFVPAGLKQMLTRRGFQQIEEFHWWEDISVNGVKITFVPAQHWTRRHLWDMNSSHWGGWVLEADHGPSVYFAGDSGYFRGFKEIGRKFDIDVALLPIGAYDPEWFMASQHINPEEALKAYLDVGASTFVPMHYGAFKLSDDTPSEALERLEKERDRLGIPEEKIIRLQHGETMRFYCLTPELNEKDGSDS
jgi:L-ascorbate metabolism protein UlaG (beta-lactamase superfamily)